MRGDEQPVAAVGTDIIRIARIDDSLRRFGDRFVRRVFTRAESRYCDTLPGQRRVASYAARFAGKEAVIKILGSSELTFTDVEIVRDGDGRPGVRLHGPAQQLAATSGLSTFAVSLSHDDEYAVATAIGLRGARDGAGPNAEVVRLDDPRSRCRVRLLAVDEASFPRIREVYRIEEREHGRVRNMTRATANSMAAWQTTTKALQIYGSLRTLDRPLVDLMCLYTSLLNGCAYCIDDAAGEAMRSGWRPDQLLALGGDHTAAYPARTVVALRYAAAIAASPPNADDELMEQLRFHFVDDEAMLELTAVLAMKNFWNRFATALRIPPEGKCGDTTLLSALLDLSLTLRRGE